MTAAWTCQMGTQERYGLRQPFSCLPLPSIIKLTILLSTNHIAVGTHLSLFFFSSFESAPPLLLSYILNS